MASTKASNRKFLTLVVLFIVFVSLVVGDLAPKEDEDEDVKPPIDVKKVEEIITTLEPPKAGSNLGFIHAFIASFSVIMVSEIGDKTFFIAAIMSMVIQQLLNVLNQSVIKKFLIFLEISSFDCFCWCNRRSSFDDRAFSGVRDGVYSIYSNTYNPLGFRPFVCGVWTEDVA